jgi:sporulation integral membrane protein YtvI
MTEVETRKQFLVHTAYIAVIALSYYLFMRYAFWAVFPFLFSLFIAMVLQRPINFIVKNTKLKKNGASVFCVLGLLLVAMGIISLIGVKLVTEIRGLFASLAENFEDLPTFLAQAETTILEFIRFLPDGLESSVGTSIRDLFEKLASNENTTFDFSMLYAPISSVWSTAKAVPEFVVAIIVSVVACFFMAADYDTLTDFIKRQLPENKSKAVAATKKTTLTAVGKLVKAYATLMLLTFCEMIVGLNIMRFAGLYIDEYLLATAVIVAVVDIVPILGTGTILIPWAIYSLLSGSTGFGIGLIVLYVVIYVIRQALEPKLVAANLDLPSILTLMSMYVGVKLFGFIGLFILPFTIMLIKILNDEGVVNLWKTLAVPTQKNKKDCPTKNDDVETVTQTISPATDAKPENNTTKS